MKYFSQKKTQNWNCYATRFLAIALCLFSQQALSQIDPIADFDTPLSVGAAFENANTLINCGQYSFTTYGTANMDEVGQRMLALPNGHLILASNQNGDIILAELDTDLNQVWQEKIAFSALPEYITDLQLDSDNNLLGVGHTDNIGQIDAFAFKFDLQTQSVVWSKKISANTPRLYTLMEKEPGGNYQIFGQTQQNSSPGLGCDAAMIELDRATGEQVWAKNYVLGSCETFVKTIRVDDALYSTGRYNFAGGGTSRMRPGISKLSDDGTLLWSRLYLVSTQTDARLYSTDIVEDEGHFLIPVNGDKSGTSTSEPNFFLFKIDADGNLQWAKEYEVMKGHTVRTYNMLKLSDGYLLLGTYFTGNVQKSFLIKTDKNGSLLWSKSYGGPGAAIASEIKMIDDAIYILGGTDSFGAGGLDVFLAKLNQDGEIEGEACDFIANVFISESDFDNPADEEHSLLGYDSPYTMIDAGDEETTAMLEAARQCESACPSCEGSIVTLPEPATICDPVSFNFSGDCEAASYFWSFCDPTNPSSCMGINMPSSTSANPIVSFTSPGTYIIQLTVNEGLADQLMVTDTLTIDSADCCEGIVIECPPDRTIFCGDSTDPGNLGMPIIVDSCGTVFIETEEFFDPTCGDAGVLVRSFMITDESASSLTCTQFITIMPDCDNFTVDLGPNQELCQGAVTLTANHGDPACSSDAGVLTYLWSNGATTESITVDQPGDYSVEVNYCNQCIAIDTVSVIACVDCPTELFPGGNIEAGPCVDGVVIIEGLSDPFYEGLALETVWLQSTNGDDCDNAIWELVPINVGATYNAFLAAGGFGVADPNIAGTSWSFVTDNDGDDLQLTVEGLMEASCFMRCTRVAGCERFLGEGNIITVDPCLAPLVDNSGSRNLGLSPNTLHDISLFPNPAKAAIHLESTDFIDQEVRLQIYDNLGRLVYSQLSTLQDRRISIALNTFQNGLYFANIRVNDIVVTKRFVVH